MSIRMEVGFGSAPGSQNLTKFWKEHLGEFGLFSENVLNDSDFLESTFQGILGPWTYLYRLRVLVPVASTYSLTSAKLNVRNSF